MKSKLTKLFTLLAVLIFGISNVWGAINNTTVTKAGGSQKYIDVATTAASTGDEVTVANQYIAYTVNELVNSAIKGVWYTQSSGGSGSSNTDAVSIAGYRSQCSKYIGVSSSKKYTHYVTNCISFSALYDPRGGSRYCTITATNVDDPTDVLTVTNSGTVSSGTKYNVELSGLSSSKYYSVVVETNNSNDSRIYQIRLEAPAATPVCPSGLTISSKDSKTAFTEGDKIELTAALSAGNGAITYQWYKGGTAEANKLTGKTAAKLEIASCVEGDAGDYYCVASKSDCSDAVNADAFTITVAHNPCATYFWFFSDADQTANGKTNATSVFSNMVSGSSNQSGSIEIDGTTYNITRRSGDADPLGQFSIPANKAGTFYALAASSGSARKIVLTNTATSATYKYDVPSSTYERVEIGNLPPGTYTIGKEGGNTRLGMVALKVCDATFRTITLKYADGTTPDGSLSALDGAPATKPTDPTWDHHRFDGWYNGASPYDWTANVTGDLTLTAHWTQLYTVTFAAGEGSGDAPAAVADKAQGETFTVPANTFTAPTNKEFDKWNDGSIDYNPNDTYTVGTENVVLTAQWKALADKYTVIFKDGETTLDTKLFEVGSNPSDADIDKTKPLFAFAAWQKESADIALDDAFWATVVKDATVTLTARWTKAFATSYDMEAYAASAGADKDGLESELTAAGYAYTNINGIDNGHTHNYTYDGMKYKTNDGDLSFNVVAGKVVEVKTGHLPSNDAVIMNINGVADATVFEGADEASETHKTNYFYSAVEALYRLDVLASKGTCAVKAVTIRDPFTVSFEAHGDADPSPLNGTPSVTLPDATNGTASLLGWFDAETGGNKIGDAGATYIPTANITLHAQWESVSTDARLASITFSAAGTLSPAFDPEVTNYTYTMPYGTAAVPTITSATSVSAKAQAPVIDQQAAAWGQTAIIRGVAESGDSKAYNITMKLAPKDGICLIKGNVGNDTFVIDEEASLLSGTADKNNVRTESSTYDTKTGWKFNARPARLGITLSGAETFQAGDIVEVFVTTVANISGANDKMRIFDANEGTSAHLLVASEDDLVQGANRLVLPTTSTNSLYLHRTKDGDYDNFNPYVAYVAVYRPMNPILTAITFAGEAGTINESLKTVTVTVPNATDLGSMTVVPTIVRNAPHATTPEAVITNAGAWVEGPNTYRIMDKDGDYTDYTVTITRAALSTDATLSALSYGTPATAIALADGVYTYDVELPYGTSDVPALAATKNHVGATIVSISDAAAFVDRKATSTVTVKAEDNTTTQVYTVNFEVSRFESKLIWDGSTMSALSDITAAATAAGVSITSADISVTSFSAVTCEENGKSYTKALNIGGNTKSTRYFGIEIPAGKVAKVSLVYKARGNETRSIIIGTAIVGAVDESAITSVERENDQALHIMTADMFGGGTLYINTTNGFHVHEISIQLADGYARSAMLGNGVLGTVCVPNNVAVEDIQGATFYELAGREPEHGKLAFDEITSGELEAGAPYVFQAQGNHIALLYGATHVDNPVDKHNGMYGTFTDITLTELTDVYYFAQKALWGCSDLTSLSVPANRAYVKLSEIDYLSDPNPAPGRRRILMGVNGENQATGFENIESGDAPMKVMIDGTLYILRGEKVFDATGRLVK